MAAGVLTLASGFSVDVLSSSCFHAIDAIHRIRPSNQVNAFCSSDPVVAGTDVTFEFSTAPFSVVHAVVSSTASPFDASDLGSRASDWGSTPFLLQALLVVAAVFILFQGYRAGDKT